MIDDPSDAKGNDENDAEANAEIHAEANAVQQALAEIKAEPEDYSLDEAEKRRLERLFSGQQVGTSTRQKPKRKKSAPKKRVELPGSSLSTERSLEDLWHRSRISEEIDLITPLSSERAEAPPPGHFTLNESFFYTSLQWFPMPGVIIRFLKKYGLASSQISPRAMCHLVGILIQSYEWDETVRVSHLQNLFEFRKNPNSMTYYVSNKRNMKIIGGFKNKDSDWESYFFFVPANDGMIEATYVRFIKTEWGSIGGRAVVSLGDLQRIFLSSDSLTHFFILFCSSSSSSSFSKKYSHSSG